MSPGNRPLRLLHPAPPEPRPLSPVTDSKSVPRPPLSREPALPAGAHTATVKVHTSIATSYRLHSCVSNVTPGISFGCSYVAADAFRGRGMKQAKGSIPGDTSGGAAESLYYKVSCRPTVARNWTRSQWRPHRPNGKRFVNIEPDSHNHWG